MFSMSKSECKLDNIFFWKLRLKLMYFLYHNLILFSEKNYKKQVQMFYQNNSLGLQTAKFCSLILRNYRTRTWKILDGLTGIGLTL